MSKDSDSVPAGAVNLVGEIIGDATVLTREKGAGKITIVNESEQEEKKK